MHLPPMHNEVILGRLLAFTAAKQGILQMIALLGFRALGILSLIEQICQAENLQFHVMYVEHLAYCGLPTLKITGEESSTHVNLRSATSLYGRIASTAAVGEEVLNLQLPGAQHLIPAGGVAEAEVTVAGVVRVEHAPATPLSCQQLVILYLVEDVSFVEIHHILQMSALIEECD